METMNDKWKILRITWQIIYLWNVLEFSDGVWIRDECQSGSGSDNIGYVFTRFKSQIAQNGEYSYSGK